MLAFLAFPPFTWNSCLRFRPRTIVDGFRRTTLVVKRNRFFVETPKPKEGPFKKPKFQLKHFFSDETASFGRKTLFRPKYFVSAEFLHQSLNKILAETRVFGWNR